jgi:ABC-type nickel/cobalt efflux system permease component RcnA
MHHALEADHLAAVASLVTKENDLNKRKAMRHGIFWGIGHTLTLFIVGIIFISMSSLVPDNLAQYLEFAVGIMLLLLGTSVIYRLFRDKVHFHQHQHEDGKAHFHAHSHRDDSNQVHDKLHHHSHDVPYRSLFVGLMHGMAGSAVLVMLTLDTFNELWLGALYVILFGVGSIIGMAILSVIISVPMRASKRLTWLNNSLTASVGVMTLVLGLLTIVETSPF